MRTAWPAFAKALERIAKESAGPLIGGAKNAELGYPPGGLKMKSIWIAMGRVSCDSNISGWAQRDETLSADIRIVINATKFDTALDAAADIIAAIEAGIAADMTLGGAVDLANVSGITFEEAIPDEKTRQVGATVTVTASATVSDR